MSVLNGPVLDTVSVFSPLYTTLNNETLANPTLGLLFLLSAARYAREGHFQCENSVWIPLSKKCDGFNDCGDFSDEKDCGPELYKGARIIRGRDWQWGNQDGDGPGTVIQTRADNWVEVAWDTGNINLYRMGADDKYDLKPMDYLKVTAVSSQVQSTVTSAGPTAPFLTIAVHCGSRVVRAQSWKWGDQDGNPPGQGVVTEIGEDWITVEWDAGKINRYRFGVLGMYYDVMVLDSRPYIGARVLRGKDWQWDELDGGGPGTIMTVRDNGLVDVIWDNGYHRVYRMGYQGKYDLNIVGQQVRVNTQVVRGKDWSWNNHDEHTGKPGNVTFVYPDGWVAVNWGTSNEDYVYRMGSDLKYDLRPLACIGGRVARGRDWIWEDQDGVPPSHGTITEIKSDGWVAVQWDSGHWNEYRLGVDGNYDLRLVSHCRPDGTETLF